MESSKVHKLSDHLGVRYDGGTILYDITGCSAIRREVLDDCEVNGLIMWYQDGLCPVCHEKINEGEIICDACFADAQRFPARADALSRHLQAQGGKQ